MKVPAHEAKGELREKGSRFLARVYRVRDEEEIRDHLEHAEQEWPDATHLCYAWRLEGEGRTRAHDAGEPRGTAGPPILSAIEERDLLECLVLVVRWFGGVKLGKGGLVRAYREAARLALEAAGVRRVPRLARLAFAVDVGAAGAVPALVARSRGRLVAQSYQRSRARFVAEIPEEMAPDLRESLLAETSGAVDFEDQGKQLETKG